MVLFLSVLDWSGLESLSRFADPARCVICTKTIEIRQFGRGVPDASPMPKSVLSLRERKRSIALGASSLPTFLW